MYYSSIGILALAVLLIINYDVLKNTSYNEIIPAQQSYKRFLISVIFFYISDFIWEPLHHFNFAKTVFIETSVYFVVMAFSIALWMQFVIGYLDRKKRFAKTLKTVGLFFFFSQIAILIVNIFVPIAFWFDEKGIYHTENGRNLNFFFQILMFFTITAYMLFITANSNGDKKRRHRSIGIFCLIMMLFILLQINFPLMPFYSIGYMLGTCLLHTFVLEDEKEAHRKELENILQIEMLQEAELGSTRQLAFTDSLTGVKNKMAYMEDASGIDRRIADGIIKKFGIVVFDLNGLKAINDTKGHDEGDLYIKEASSLICSHFKHSHIYRIGGDEFIAFLEYDDYENRKELVESFNRIIESNLKEGRVVISCGLAELIPNRDKNYLKIFKRADKEMYARKQNLKSVTVHNQTSQS